MNRASSAELSPSTRRPYDAQASRSALVDAATALFDERGYEATTIRQIGELAGVDAALIARYFGGKEGIGPVPLGMVNPTLTDEMRAQLRGITHARVIEPLAAELAKRGVPDAELRAELLLATAIGVSLTRASGTL